MDYFETFSPMIKTATIRVIINLLVLNGWDIKQIDVNNVFFFFLNEDLEEQVFMSQPEGFHVFPYSVMSSVGASSNPKIVSTCKIVCRLNKTLYGLN